MDAFETFEHAGLTVELHYHEDAGDPFETFDQAAELVGFEPFARDFSVALTLDEDRFETLAHAHRYLTLAHGYLVAVPFRFHDYGSGGYRASLTTLDDDRAAGFVCVSQAGVDLTGCPDPEEAARQDFETWRQWVEGEVYGYVVKNTEGEVLDSCWGFYGDPDGPDGVKDEAKSSADWQAKEIALDVEPIDVPEVLAGVCS